MSQHIYLCSGASKMAAKHHLLEVPQASTQGVGSPGSRKGRQQGALPPHCLWVAGARRLLPSAAAVMAGLAGLVVALRCAGGKRGALGRGPLPHRSALLAGIPGRAPAWEEEAAREHIALCFQKTGKPFDARC